MDIMEPHPQVMGILNITPDSFSDGGNFIEEKAAIKHGMQMAEEGADIIDIGGESTRPGARRISASMQIKRVLPVIEGLKRKLPARTTISIDTTLAEVAEAAIRAGATMVNDISAGRDDMQMFPLVASKKIPLVLMHMQGTPEDMQRNPHYLNVVDEILSFLSERIIQAKAAGVDGKNIVIDPGIGFGKSFEHNLSIMHNLDKFVNTGYRVLLGVSRKKFLQDLCDYENLSESCGATCAITAMSVLAGIAISRVHDVRENRQIVDVISGLSKSSTDFS